MIPADVASRQQISADIALRPVAPSQEINDKLSGLIPGQRVMASIQALLPNGTYRAMINQRDVTLALPFAAKSGDALELEVVDSNGKLSLAVVLRADKEAGKSPAESVPTTLSRAGQLISTLLGNSNAAKPGPTPTALNGNQPIASAPPATAQELLPLLKQAITQSGLFYESHQAEWVDGRLAKSALLQEPQGKLSPSFPNPTPTEAAGQKTTPLPGAEIARPTTTTSEATGPKTAPLPNTEIARPTTASTEAVGPKTVPLPGAETARPATPATETATNRTAITNETGGNKAAPSTPLPVQLVAHEALPMVRQQLDALATQNFLWQGQVWPGQKMRWEIEEDAARRNSGSDETPANWQTRLHLTLPNLGEVDAQIRLQGNQISLVLSAANSETLELLHTSTGALRGQLDEAGLALASVGVGTVKNEDNNGQTTG